MPKCAAAEPRRYNEVTSAGKVNLGGRPDKSISKKGLFAIIVHRRLCLGGFPAELENGYSCFQRVRFTSASQREQNITSISRVCVCVTPRQVQATGLWRRFSARSARFSVALTTGLVRKVLI